LAHIIMHMLHMYIISIIMLLLVKTLRIVRAPFLKNLFLLFAGYIITVF